MILRKLHRVHEKIDNTIPNYIKIGKGVVFLKTKRGKKTIDKIASNSFWHIYNRIGAITILIFMLLGILLFLSETLRILQTNPNPTPINNPKNVIVIPGVNDYIPLSSGVHVLIALIVSVTVHELGHAISFRSNNIKIEEMGVLFLTIVPIGAYVKPEKELDEGSFFSRIEVSAAGITNNIVLLLFSLIYFLFFSAYTTLGITQSLVTAVANGSSSYGFASVPVIDIFIWWVWFLNLNLVIVNSLPIMGLDGGHIIHAILDKIINKEIFGYNLPVLGLKTISLIVFFTVFFALFGPHFI